MDAVGTGELPSSSAHPGRVRLNGQQRIWLFIAALVVVDVCLGRVLLSRHGLDGPPVAWLLVPAFAAAEIFVFHLQYRSNAYSFALGEVAVVVGLVHAGPLQLMLAQLLGVAAALVLHRHQSLHKLLFNLSQFALVTMLATVLFRSIVPDPGAFDVRLWGAAFLATAVATAGTGILTFTAISIAEGSPQLSGMSTTLVGAVALSLASTSLGLIAVALIDQDPRSAVLLLIPIGMLYAAYKAYLTERDNHERLDFLHRAAQTVAAAPQLEAAITGLLLQVRTMFRAEFAELTLIPASASEPPLRTRLGPGEAQELMRALPPGSAGPVPDTLFLPAPTSREVMLAQLDGEHKDAMAVALKSDGRVLGQLVVADRLSDIATFDGADLQLFRTLGAQASMALENGRLEKSLDQLTQLKEQLRHDAHHDTLTGLANRALLVLEIADACEQARGEEGRPASVLLLDLDDFKTVNDSLGHAAGDLLLIEVARRLRSCLREGDLAARLGGDEFAVLLRGTSGLEAAVDVAGRLLSALEQPVELQGRETQVHASIGIAELDGIGDGSEALRNADAAMYRAKQAGKNRYRLFEDSMHAEAVRRLELRAALQRALEGGEFVLHYQPLVDLRTGRVADAEALIRWNNPEVGMVPPAEFIGLAEETGLIVPIGRWVLQTAVHQLAAWQRTVPGAQDLCVSVNLSARQLAAPDLIDDVDRALRGSGLPPHCLVLEITESVLMEDVEAALRPLRALAQLGVGLSLDDFGTGYSSLSYLRTFPIDTLKLSKPFVDDLGDPSGHALVGAIAGLAAALRMRTVAEGIESLEQAAVLRELGYDLGQGYSFSPPMAAEAFARLVAEQPFLTRVVPGPVVVAGPR